MKVYTAIIGQRYKVPFSSDGQYIDCMVEDWRELSHLRKTFSTRAKAETYCSECLKSITVDTANVREEEID